MKTSEIKRVKSVTIQRMIAFNWLPMDIDLSYEHGFVYRINNSSLYTIIYDLNSFWTDIERIKRGTICLHSQKSHTT